MSTQARPSGTSSVPTELNGQSAEEEYLVTAESEQTPVLSVVMPTLNEEGGIAECIQRIKVALKELQIPGEIVVSDSSTDRTPEIAREMGARVVTPDGAGYGYAYRYAFERTRGELIAMGDADTTYDFEELPAMVEMVRVGKADMVLGSRLQGQILPGAMPSLHKFVGNPLLTRFLNTFYGTNVSDAHSGMRVFSRDAYERMNLGSTGMEFASEMIMEAGARGLVIEEVPITYHPRKGEATLDSFRDGWRHVRFMLINAPGYLFSGPGILLSSLGLFVLLVALSGASIGPFVPSIRTILAGSLFILVGAQVTCLGAFATVAGEPVREAKDPITRFIIDHVQLEHGATTGVLVFGASALYSGYAIFNWWASGLTALPSLSSSVVALTAMILGMQLVFTAFFLSTIADS
ncbi:glycosyltransferase family 2 protein [Halogeometricum limi]|uniref:Glycosyltransferase involved in cell wall bisynthesis n=1 Tax=Halogeometricum limi TaxID=555875 RepID=A0A1I6IKX7_9EURY|nr:glycosyltransferase family 2 protein [Halogeometricum limi]SFR66950.1 Glycosyltransferase involved in cell wall bisynthesis [Halogeometricum limi]